MSQYSQLCGESAEEKAMMASSSIDHHLVVCLYLDLLTYLKPVEWPESVETTSKSCFSSKILLSHKFCHTGLSELFFGKVEMSSLRADLANLGHRLMHI